MDFEKATEYSRAYTEKASDVGRNLALAGLAITWVASGGGTSPPEDVDIGDFGLPIVILAGALALDFGHYLGQSLYLRRFVRDHEDELKQPGGRKLSRRNRDFGDVMFVAKLGATTAGYLALMVVLSIKFLF